VGANLAAAKAAGLSADAYAFISNGCNGNYESVLTQIKSALGGHTNKIWFDIEQCGGCWGGASANLAFLKAAAAYASKIGLSWGVYSSPGEWPQVMGSGTFGQGDLWYADWDN